MQGKRRAFRLGLQAKILIPVIAFLVMLPVITVLIVGRYIHGQQQAAARAALTTADTVFQQLLDSQGNDLISKYRPFGHDPSLILLMVKRNKPAFAPTVQQLINDRLEEHSDDASAILFTLDGDRAPIGKVHDVSFDVTDFARATSHVTDRAFDGGPSVATVVLKDDALHVVGIPMDFGDVKAAFTIGARIGEGELRQMKQRTNTDILLLSGGKVLASTMPVDDALAGALAPLLGAPAQPAAEPTAVMAHGEHFLAMSGSYGQGPPGQGLRYILLSSLEASLGALADTQRLLVEISLIGIAISGMAVWFLIRRFIQPLRDLGETAEAVGRGDFSRRLELRSNDECADLADAFNRMTASLQSSHAQLEKTVETLKATQNQLIQSEKLSAVGQFVAGVAHELNNPLTAVIGFSDLLCQTSSDPRNRTQLELIAKSAHRCHKIVHNLLSFARQHAPERKLTQINGVIDEVIEIMAYDFRTSNIAVVRDFEAGLPPITVDPHQLQQVFVNILSNARQAIEPFRPDGRITVRTRAADDRVRIEFADNGPGIRPENLPKIFDPFFTTKPVGKGTGLGLSLTYGIIQEHEGRIRAESTVGQGATFVIELPKPTDAQAPAREASRSVSLRQRASQPSGKSVLVVDDEEWILSLIEHILENDGHEVETAQAGEQAITALRRRKFDVVVCDWKMPGLNGIQFYEHLLSTDPAMAERVLFMSGDIINDSFQAFLQRRGRRCLSKPFPIEEFQSAVEAILAS